MSTRAVYTFQDGDGDAHHVYVHHDGYPTGAADKFRDALNSGQIWDLPRFEADEFAAGFVAANKGGSGSVRLAHSPERYGDIEYHYTITQAEGGALHVRADAVNNWNGWHAETLWAGPLDEFINGVAAQIETDFQN